LWNLLAAVALLGLAIGLFIGLRPSAAGGPPRAGGAAPAFSLSGVNVAEKVGTPESGGGDGKPVVVLFMGDWCTICHSEMPPLAAKIKVLRAGHGALSHLAVIGVDSEDTLSDALSLVKASGITFPVGDDSTARVLNGLYEFEGDPYAVFIEGNGTIMTIHPGALSPVEFVELGKRLVST
jgi:thiol-disulfide isomerase/thioredoxin